MSLESLLQGGDKIHFDKLERSPSGLTEVPQGQALLGRNCKVRKGEGLEPSLEDEPAKETDKGKSEV